MDNKQPQQQQPTPQQPSTSTQSTPANRDCIEELNKNSDGYMYVNIAKYIRCENAQPSV